MSTEIEDPRTAAAMCALAAVALGVANERFPTPSAAPKVRGALQDLRRVLSAMYSYNSTLATGSPVDVENWRRDGSRIRAQANETLQKFLDACLPSLGTEPQPDELHQEHHGELECMAKNGVGR